MSAQDSSINIMNAVSISAPQRNAKIALKTPSTSNFIFKLI